MAMKENVDTILFLKIAKDARRVNMLNSVLKVRLGRDGVGSYPSDKHFETLKELSSP